MLHRPGVLALFRGQAWVAHVRQLGELGVSEAAVWKACQQGLVCRVLTGVVGVAGAWETFEGRVRALQLATRGAGFISGTTAGRLHGLRGMPELPVECTVPETRRQAVPAWARVVRSSWTDVEPRPARTDGIVVASPPRMLFQLAVRFNQYRFERAAEDAWHLGLIDPGGASDYLQRVRRRGRTGVARFELWLARTAAIGRPATTGLEQLLVDLCRRAGLPEPVRQHPLVLASGELVHLDLAWPAIRWAVEPGHSWWHGGDLRQRADQDRDRACGEVGWLVSRFDESAWERQGDVVRQLRAIHARRCRDVGAHRASS